MEISSTVSPAGTIGAPVARRGSPPPIGRWLLLSSAGSLLLLLSVLAVAEGVHGGHLQRPEAGPPFLPGTAKDLTRILGGNLLVLALFAVGPSAAYLADRRLTAAQRAPADERLRRARLVTIVLVGLIALVTAREVYLLGDRLSDDAGYFYEPAWRLWVGVLPHAVPELSAMLLAPAAWVTAWRREQLQRLGTATVAAILLAVPILACAAVIEVYLSPFAFRALTCIAGSEGFPQGKGCGPLPACPELTPAEFERRYHIRLTNAETEASRLDCHRSQPVG